MRRNTTLVLLVAGMSAASLDFLFKLMICADINRLSAQVAELMARGH